MIRLGAAMWVGVIAVAAGAAFGISFEVQSLREHLAAVNRDIASEEDTIRVLKAEWAYMTQPTRLREMAQEYTELAPIVPGQMLEDAAALPMPLRSPDAPPVNGTPGAPPEDLVAMMDVPGFGMAPFPARRGEPRTGGLDAGGHASEAAPAAASPSSGGYDAPPPMTATTEAPAIRRSTAPPPASPPAVAAPAPRVVPAAPDDDPIAALLVSFGKEP